MRREVIRDLRVIVLGYIVRGPLGGLAWHHLQYVLGLARLDCDVYFLEDSDDYPGCYDPTRGALGTDPSYGLRFAAHAFSRLGLGERWAYHDAHAGRWHGPCGERAASLAAGADLLLNLSGMNPLRPWLRDVSARAFVDTDPVFTQIRHLTDPDAQRLAAEHTAFFTFGENTGRAGCTVPADGLAWQPTRQPVVLDRWPVTPGPENGAFTTVMQWDSYEPREYGGRRYGMKSESFQPYLDLPAATGATFELALGGATAPRALLRRNGWKLRDSLALTREPWVYQRYLRRSKAEFSVAKHGYVTSHSGWFSERSAAYLAGGRPVLVQDTGFTEWLHAEGGVVPFTTPAEAVAGVEKIAARYAWHCAQARSVVEQYFDAAKVLTSLVERALNPAIATAT